MFCSDKTLFLKVSIFMGAKNVRFLSGVFSCVVCGIFFAGYLVAVGRAISRWV